MQFSKLYTILCTFKSILAHGRVKNTLSCSNGCSHCKQKMYLLSIALMKFLKCLSPENESKTWKIYLKFFFDFLKNHSQFSQLISFFRFMPCSFYILSKCHSQVQVKIDRLDYRGTSQFL